jgi:hypothetical protein
MAEDVADLTLRAGVVGLATQMRVPIRFLDPRNRAVVLVHGFNVPEKEGFRVLDNFKRTLSHYAPGIEGDTFLCTWPGEWPSPHLPHGVRGTAYPRLVGTADRVAAVFWNSIFEWYARPSAPSELVIVAHSLGCRVTLGMLQAMTSSGKPQNLKRLVVILMAAAVPVKHVEMEGIFKDVFTVVDTVVVLHSEADVVLSTLFPVGQTLALDGWFPEAVGLRGNPRPGRWNRTERMQGFDHSDYWEEMETAVLIASMLGFAARRHDVGIPLATRKRLAAHNLPLLPLLPIS